MTDTNENILCKSCGLCCSGHLFAWVRLNAPELDHVEKLGLKVIRDDPHQRGFTQPCAMWSGTCAIYTSPHYPRSCQKYKCKVFRQLVEGDVNLQEGLEIIQNTLVLIREIELMLQGPSALSFRERLLSKKEALESKKEMCSTLELEFLKKAESLLSRYENDFGVDDFIDYDN